MSIAQIVAKHRRAPRAVPTTKKRARSARDRGPEFIVDPKGPDYPRSTGQLRDFADHLNVMLQRVRATQKADDVLSCSIWLACVWEVAKAGGLGPAELQARHLWQKWDLSKP